MEGVLICPEAQSKPLVTTLNLLSTRLPQGELFELTIVTPGSKTLHVFVDAPELSGSRLEKALYWSVEPSLSTDIGDNHVCWQKSPTEDRPARYLVMATAQHVTQQWAKKAVALNATKTNVVSFCQYLDKFQLDSELFNWQSYSFLLTSDGLVCMETQHAAPLMAQKRPLSIGVSTSENLDENVVSVQNIATGAMTAILSSGVQGATTFLNSKASKVFLSCTTLSALCILVYFAVIGARYDLLADKNVEKATVAYKSWFPEERRMIDIRRQLQGKLRREQTGGGSPLDATDVSQMIDVFSNSIEENRSALQVRRLRYEENQRLLESILLSTTIEDLEALELSLKNKGYALNIQSVTKKSEGFEVSAVLRGGKK